jgi:hypothetical protein
VNDIVRISRRTLFVAAGALVAVLLGLALVTTGVIARAAEGNTVANATVMKTQQSAAERDIERAYEQAVDQVHKVRALNLAITAAQADAIAQKTLSDLKALRHSAFVSLGQVLGLADVESYATGTEQRFDQAPVAAQPSPAPVLLAPRLYAIVARMSELATQLSDQATTSLTAPAATPAPTVAPSPSRTTSPSPSPTARP